MNAAPVAPPANSLARRSRLLRPQVADRGERRVPPQENLAAVIDAPQRWRQRAERRGADADRQWRMGGLVWVPGQDSAGGDGPRRCIPVVLIHGLIVAARMCAPTARRLAPDGLVVAPDLPGSGRSSKPEPVPTVAELGAAVAAWLRTSRLPPVVLVGNSVGTQVALHAAREAPEAVTGLVLASPTVDRRRRRWRQQLWRWQLEQRTQSPRLRAVQVADYARAGVARAITTFSSALADRPEALLPHIDVPVLACLGSRDPLLTREWVREVADAAPRGDFVVLPGVVHAMSHDNPLELARVVNGFIDRLAC